MVLYDSSGRIIKTGAEVGRGGEGTIFAVDRQPDLLAKVYHSAPSARKAEKLAQMAGARTDALARATAWPTSVLRSSPGGPAKGLLMPRVTGHKEAHQLYSPKSRRDEFANADYAFLVHTAINIAGAFSVVHDHDHVVGDVNHGGVLVSEQGTATLIDCDSFQVKTQAGVFRCEVGVPEYTPPELQGQRLDQADRAANHDAFGLAVMVFHLLFMGRHPYAGTPTDGTYVPIDKAILQHRFAYASWARAAQIAQPPNTLPLSNASPPIAALFERAFGPLAAGAKRPTAMDWVRALTALKGSLTRCFRVPNHTYWKGAGTCPWCQFEKTIGIDYFPALVRAAAAGAMPAFDLDAAWRGIEGVLAPPPLQAPTLSARPSTKPSRRALRARSIMIAFRATVMLAVVAMGLVGLVWGFGQGLPLLGLALWIAGFATWNKSRTWQSASHREAANTARKAKQEYDVVLKSADLSANGFTKKLENLKASRQRLAGLPQERQQALAELENQRRERQLERYLSRQRIAKARIPGIGSGLTQTLASFGFETAADVSWAIGRVPGFGQQRVRSLMDWRRSVEKHFVFDPNQGVDPGDVATINNRLNAVAKSLEAELRSGKSALLALREKMNQDITAATKTMEGILSKYDQALCDAVYLGVEA